MDAGLGFALGVLGGVITELYALYQLRKKSKDQRPDWITDRFYWIVTIPMILFGGLVAVAYITSGAQLTPLLAIHLGAATPTLIGAFSKAPPEILSAS